VRARRLPAALQGLDHPRIADPRKEDKQFIEDTQFCKDKLGPQGGEAAQKPAMDECYRRLGWQRKD